MLDDVRGAIARARLQAGVGDLVLTLTEGTGARQIFGLPKTADLPIRTLIVGIVALIVGAVVHLAPIPACRGVAFLEFTSLEAAGEAALRLNVAPFGQRVQVILDAMAQVVSAIAQILVLPLFGSIAGSESLLVAFDEIPDREAAEAARNVVLRATVPAAGAAPSARSPSCSSSSLVAPGGTVNREVSNGHGRPSSSGPAGISTAKVALTIAIKYALRRRQFEARAGGDRQGGDPAPHRHRLGAPAHGGCVRRRGGPGQDH